MGLLYDDIGDLDRYFKSIKNTVETKDKRIEYLEKENKKLKDEAYKDNELKAMQKQLERMKADYRRGFPMTEAEEKAIEKWHKEHNAKVHKLKTEEDRIRASGCCGGGLTYCYIPCALGVLGYVKCHCGAEFTFSDICQEDTMGTFWFMFVGTVLYLAWLFYDAMEDSNEITR